MDIVNVKSVEELKNLGTETNMDYDVMKDKTNLSGSESPHIRN